MDPSTFYPSELIYLSHFNVRYPVVILKALINSRLFWFIDVSLAYYRLHRAAASQRSVLTKYCLVARIIFKLLQLERKQKFNKTQFCAYRLLHREAASFYGCYFFV